MHTCVCCAFMIRCNQESTATPSPPTSATLTPPSSVSTAGSDSGSGISGVRRKLESEFDDSPEPPSKLPRYDTMKSFSFNADSSPNSTENSQLFATNTQAGPLEYFRNHTSI